MLRSLGVALIATLYLAPLAQAADRLSTGDRLPDRRYVVSGPRAYEVGAEDGSYPAMGFHTRGEMGGIWAPPIKLLDGVWAGIDGQWIGPATQFTSGWGHVEMALPGRPGLTVTRTDFVPGAHRGVLIGLRFASTGAAQSFELSVDAHSELMGAYPWGETKPFDQRTFNLQDTVARDGRALVFREQGTPVKLTFGMGILIAALAAVVPLSEIVKLVKIGTLFAFLLVNIGVIILRRTRPDLKRGFRVPFVPVFPIIGTLLCIYLMRYLDRDTWIRFIVWLAIGLVIYFLYGRRHSRLRQGEVTNPEAHLD